MRIGTSGMALLAAVSLAIGHGAIAAEPVGKDIATTAVEAGSFGTLAAALEAAGLIGTLQGKGPFTVFAPTDEAFAKLPAGTVETLLEPENKKLLISVLTYHVVPGRVTSAEVVKRDAIGTANGQRVNVLVDGDEVRVNGASLLQADIACSNGVIHVIDSVLLPSADSIPTTADKAGIFKTLLAVAKAAGLVEALSGDQPLTVFAPTDDAFAALPKGTVESLLKPENQEKLASILKYHVVAGRVYSGDLRAGKAVQTLQGCKLTASVKDRVTKVINARLLKADIDAANGVVHVIDTVLLPPAAPANGAAVPHHQSRYVSAACPNSRPVVYYQVRTSCRR